MKKFLAVLMVPVFMFPMIAPVAVHAQTVSVEDKSALIAELQQAVRDILNQMIVLVTQQIADLTAQNAAQAQVAGQAQVEQTSALNKIIQQQQIIMAQTQAPEAPAAPVAPTISVGSAFCQAEKMYLPVTVSGVFTSLTVRVDSSGGTGNGGGVHGGQSFQSSNAAKSVDAVFNVDLGYASALDPAQNHYRLAEENPYINGSTFAYTVSVLNNNQEELANAVGPLSFPSCN